MDNETQTDQTKRTYFIGSVILLMVILIGFVMYIKGGVKTTTTAVTTQVTSTTPVERPTTGSFNLVSGSSTAKVGQATAVSVIADTAAKDLVGYDIVFSVPADKMSQVTAKSLLPDFQVFVKEGIGDVTVTGIRGLSVTSEQVFTGTPIVELTFMPKVAGNLNLTIMSENQNRGVTKFVDTKTQLFYPKVAGASLSVQ